ncbi:gag/pol/env polyprotein, putative [Perkinsus marinus ATCC 50983]|uniref:Gag/pol/env polyprotein, putative n=1 Tax=Perkinsus marinus (strain ATCC 50983 / TXsc) TaxID=423536 RepID=C5KCK3_PERM5|nr:gag/pol/env polyprotein, putative [Perkinsus marinus ATCC 50983]EER17602.1 gag/pol/env polyprotein, putative [Perkinsus marinus ATCC 50983]|eukprot:XP_002785806.1 gag/pol/env polyprotein, putative [Perkinsus marinus ATCC 50983]
MTSPINELRPESERDILTSLGAGPRTSLTTQVRLMETAIYENSTASYVPHVSTLGESIKNVLCDNDDFKADIPTVGSGEDLCALWRPSFAWLMDEMIYPYPFGDEHTTRWFDPLIDWCIINAAANIPQGTVFVGRQTLKQQLATSVTASKRASHAQLALTCTAQTASSTDGITLPSHGSLASRSNAQGALSPPTATSTPSLQSHESSMNIPYDSLKKKIKAVVGEPPAKELVFDGTSSENYLQWRVAILEKLNEFDDVPNRVQAEAVLACVAGPTKASLKRDAPRDIRGARGAMAIIDLLDKRFRTSLALKSFETKFEGLHQEPGESLLSYATRFQNLLHVKVCSSPDEQLKDSTIIRHFTRGLRDAGAILSATLIDPLKTMDFHTFKDSLLAVRDDMPSALTAISNAASTGGNRPKPQTTKSGKHSEDADVVAICLSAATDLGLNKDACLRCGNSGHLAATCPTPSDAIVRLADRCRRCGCIKKDGHKCNYKRFVCGRCRRRNHLAGVCLKTLSAPNSPTPTATDTLTIVKTAAVNVSAIQVDCRSSATSLLHGVPADPTINLRFGKDPLIEYCEVPGLVDTGANLSLMDYGVFHFLNNNNLISAGGLQQLSAPVHVTFGNHSTTDTSQVLTTTCSIASDNTLTEKMTFLLVPHCNPTVIIGRNMFSALGIRLKSDKVRILPYLGCCTTSTQTQVSSAQSSELTSSPASVPGHGAIPCLSVCSRAVACATTPLIERVVEDGQPRLVAHLPAIENANVYPYRAAKRRRPPTDDAIIHSKLLEMSALGKASLASDKDVTVVCQPVLIDKWDQADGTSKQRTFPLSDAELKRYRLTIDCRPLNNLRLLVDADGTFLFMPVDGAQGTSCKGNEEHVYKQYQRGATVLLRDIPGEHMGYWSKVDLEDAYGTLRVSTALSRLFGTVSIDSNGQQHVWTLRSLAQGWRWAPLLFQLAMTTIIDEDINPALAKAGLKASVIHVQDDILIASCDIDTGNRAFIIVTDILEQRAGFIVNRVKSQPPGKIAGFCGLQLCAKTYRPTPSRREFTEATYTLALNDFINCNPIRGKRGKKKAATTGNQLRDRRLQWLRSWCGVFNYLNGHLSPEAQHALNQLYSVTKIYQNDDSSTEDFDATIDTVSSAFRVLADFYLSGVIPCAIGNDGIATLVVTDANADAYGGIILRIIKVGAGAEEFAAATKTVLKHVPDLGVHLDEDTNLLAVVPIKTCGARWSRVESSRSSTWRERAALLNVVQSCQALLFGKCIAIIDNINAQRVWNELEAEFSVGSYLSKWQIVQRHIHSFAWAPRETLPAIADAIARSISPNTHGVNVHISSAQVAATDGLHFKPDYLPGYQLRAVFMEWRSTSCTKEFTTFDDDFDCLQWLAKAQAECPQLQQLRQVNPGKYQLNDAGLLHVNGRYMVPKCYGQDMIRRVHESYAHCGVAQCISLISSVFYLVGLAMAVAKVLSRCRCFFIRAARLHRPPSGTLKRRREVMELIYVDIVGPLPLGHLGQSKFRYILTWMCAASHFIGAIPLSYATSEAVANALERNVIDVFGRVKEIAADNGSQFRSASFAAWCGSLSIRCWHIPVFAPWRNALLERQHKSIKASLKVLIDSVEHRWPQYLSKAVSRCNNRDLGSGITPSMPMFGDDRTALRRFCPPNPATMASSLNDAVRAIADIRNKRLVTLFGDADISVSPVPDNHLSRRHNEFKIGDVVLRWTPAATGLQPNWKGPHTVVATPGHFTVLLSDGSLQDTRNVRRYFGKGGVVDG